MIPTYDLHSDEELIELVKTGEEAAFNIIYSRYWERLFFVAVKKLQDEAEAQEAVQDIFYALWKNRERFQLRGNLENYLSVAIKFQVIQRMAKRQRRSQIEQSLAKEGQQAQQLEMYDQWGHEDLEQLHEKLQLAIGALLLLNSWVRSIIFLSVSLGYFGNLPVQVYFYGKRNEYA